MVEARNAPGLRGADPQTARAGSDESPQERRVAWLLLAIALAPALLRLWGLDRAGLWIDEAFTLSDALHGALEDNPLGYRWMAAWLGNVDGRPTEADLRWLPALFGALCVPLTYWAFAERVGRRSAAGAALLLAVSSWHLYWSRTADFYTFVQALSLVGTGTLLRGLDRGLGAWVLVGLGLAGFAAWIHPSAAFALPGLALLPFLPTGLGQARPSKPLRLGLALLIGVALIGAFGWGSGVIEQWRKAKTPLGPAHLVLTSGFFFQPWLLAGGVVGLWSAWRRPAPALVAIALVPLVGFAAALAATPFLRLTAQYVFVLLPWVCVVAAGAWCRTSAPMPAPERDAWSRLGAVTVFLVSASMFTQVALYFGPRNEERPAWREAYRLVAEQREPGDLILGMAAPIGEYYLTADRTHLRELTQLEYLDTYRAPIERFWERRGRRTWFVVNPERLKEWRPEFRDRLLQVLRDEARLIASYPLEVESRDLSVAVFLRD
ncbi:MAG: hypothetical protein ACYS26_07630 [Planctomycetota bacterium]|jgi:hypothetical protein